MKKEISAGGIVYKKTPKGILWLIIQPSHQPTWTFPKGLVGDIHANERFEDAALREVQEEGGVTATIIAPLSVPSHYTYYWNGSPIDKTVHYFLMEYVSGSPDDHDHEVNSAQFVTEEEVKRRLSFETDKKQYVEAVALYNTTRAPLV